MDSLPPERLRRKARRCHELSRSILSGADRAALDDYADRLEQRASDLEVGEIATAAPTAPV